jgi:hypothetical protein
MIKSSSKVRFKAYNLVARAVEEGVAYGYNRAHKHSDEPSEEVIKQAMIDSILNSLCEIIDFDSTN